MNSSFLFLYNSDTLLLGCGVMRKRIYFIVSSFLTFVLSIIAMIQSKTIFEQTLVSMKEVYAAYPDLQARVVGMLENNGEIYFMVLAGITIVLSLFLFGYCLKEDHILKRKGLLIAISLIGVFFGTTSYIEALFFLNVLILLFSKRRDAEDYPEKKEIPILERKKSTKNEIIKGIVLLVVYFSQFVWAQFLPDSFEVALSFQIGFDVLMLILCVIFFFSDFKMSLRAWKGHVSAYISYIFSKYGLGLLIYFGISALAISLTGSNISINQQSLEKLPMWYVFPAAVLWAPIVEETIFRGVIRKFIKKDWLFILISAFVFGILHTYREEGIVNILVMSLPYASLGAVFAYVYVKTGNITCNMFMHAIHNTIGMIMQLFI